MSSIESALARVGSFIPPPRSRGSVSGLLAALLVFLTGCGRTVDPGPAPVIRVQPRGSQVAIVSVGDILLADAATKHLEEKGYDWPFQQVRPLLENADLVIGNLEGPITRAKEKLSSTKDWSYKARPASAPALKRAGFHALSLANNHTLDYGPEGLRDTLKALRKQKIEPFGAGADEAEARRGLVYDFGTVRVGLLSYTQYRLSEQAMGWYASGDTPGCAPFKEALLEADITRLRKQADLVIVSVHWGDNYKGVTDKQRSLGKRAIELGADLVNGHHPHIAQGIEIYRGKPIVYSVGNFVFGTPGRFKRPEDGYGLVARYLIDGKALSWVMATPIAVNNKRVGFQPQRVTPEDAKKALEPRMGRFQTEVRWAEDTAFLGFTEGWKQAALPALPWAGQSITVPPPPSSSPSTGSQNPSSPSAGSQTPSSLSVLPQQP